MLYCSCTATGIWKANLHTLTGILDSGRVTRTGSAHWAPGLPIAPAVNPLLPP